MASPLAMFVAVVAVWGAAKREGSSPPLIPIEALAAVGVVLLVVSACGIDLPPLATWVAAVAGALGATWLVKPGPALRPIPVLWSPKTVGVLVLAAIVCTPFVIARSGDREFSDALAVFALASGICSVAAASSLWSLAARAGAGRSAKVRYRGEGMLTVEFGNKLHDVVPRGPLPLGNLIGRRVTLLGLPPWEERNDPYRRRDAMPCTVLVGAPPRVSRHLRRRATRWLVWSLAAGAFAACQLLAAAL